MSIKSTGLSRHETRAAPPKRRRTAVQPVPVKYVSVGSWCEASGMGRTKSYEHFALGDIITVKIDGKRLVDLEQGLEWLANLPAVKLTTGLSKLSTASPKRLDK